MERKLFTGFFWFVMLVWIALLCADIAFSYTFVKLENVRTLLDDFSSWGWSTTLIGRGIVAFLDHMYSGGNVLKWIWNTVGNWQWFFYLCTACLAALGILLDAHDPVKPFVVFIFWQLIWTVFMLGMAALILYQGNYEAALKWTHILGWVNIGMNFILLGISGWMGTLFWQARHNEKFRMFE